MRGEKNICCISKNQHISISILYNNKRGFCEKQGLKIRKRFRNTKKQKFVEVLRDNRISEIEFGNHKVKNLPKGKLFSLVHFLAFNKFFYQKTLYIFMLTVSMIVFTTG